MSLIRDWVCATSALAASIDFPGRVEPGLLAVQRGAGGLHHGLLDVELFTGDGLAREEGAGACELELVQLQLAIGLGDRGLDLERLGLLLGDGRLGSRQLRLERDGVHLGDDLAGPGPCPPRERGSSRRGPAPWSSRPPGPTRPARFPKRSPAAAPSAVPARPARREPRPRPRRPARGPRTFSPSSPPSQRSLTQLPGIISKSNGHGPAPPVMTGVPQRNRRRNESAQHHRRSQARASRSALAGGLGGGTRLNPGTGRGSNSASGSAAGGLPRSGSGLTPAVGPATRREFGTGRRRCGSSPAGR